MIGEGPESSMDSQITEKQLSKLIDHQLESYENPETSGGPNKIVEGVGKVFVDWLETEINKQPYNDP